MTIKKSKCSTCAYARGLDYSTHIMCSLAGGINKPATAALSRRKDLLAITLKEFTDLQAKVVGFDGVNEHGFKNGWAFFPFNYDPIWLLGDCRCNLPKLDKDL